MIQNINFYYMYNKEFLHTVCYVVLSITGVSVTTCLWEETSVLNFPFVLLLNQYIIKCIKNIMWLVFSILYSVLIC